MCNLYRSDIRKAGLEREIYGFEEFSDLPRDIYPDRLAPVFRTGDSGRWEAIEMRWGFPPLPQPGARPITNVRNLASSYWRPWLKPEYRCLVPFDRFAEPLGPGMGNAWFEMGNGQVAMFAGIWRPWEGTRGPKKAPVVGDHLLYAFATCEPNEVVGPIHPKAMPVILTTDEECEAWLTESAADFPKLQRPLPAAQMRRANA